MTEPAYDLVIRGGRVATASEVFEADVAISGEAIAATGRPTSRSGTQTAASSCLVAAAKPQSRPGASSPT